MVLSAVLSACTPTPREHPVRTLEAWCAEHEGSACSAAARLHELGTSETTFEHLPANASEAARFYERACQEGVQTDCERSGPRR